MTLKTAEHAILSSKQKAFLEELEDKEYRQIFAEELIGTSLAFQIRRLRETRELTQAKLAELTGKAQETISQWENPNYGRYSLSTLKKLAAAFDVALLVRFASFSELADWTVDVDPKRLTPPGYEDERQMSFDISNEPKGRAKFVVNAPPTLMISIDDQPSVVLSPVVVSLDNFSTGYLGSLSSERVSTFTGTAVETTSPETTNARGRERDFAFAA